MCYNIELKSSEKQLIERYIVNKVVDYPSPTARLTLGNALPAIIERDNERRLGTMEWGFIPAWAKAMPKTRPGNARAETAHELPTFRTAFRRQRCIVPATGFYEWDKGPKGQKKLIPFHPADGGLITLPGLWDIWTSPEGHKRSIITILTTEPNTMNADYHDRMPVILAPEDEAVWLSPETPLADLLRMLLPYPPEGLRPSEPVSPSLFR